MRPLVDRYRPADRGALYDICLRTGDLGADAGPLHTDPGLLGDVYLGPYLELEPGLAFVLRDGDGDDGAPLGYVVGTADTTAFEDACERHWWPPLRGRERAPRPGGADERLVRIIEDGVRTEARWLARFPAHLHINLLPAARGGGHGRALLSRLVTELAQQEVPGVHLEVDAANTGAVAFYRRTGFAPLEERPGSLVMARPLEDLR